MQTWIIHTLITESTLRAASCSTHQKHNVMAEKASKNLIYSSLTNITRYQKPYAVLKLDTSPFCLFSFFEHVLEISKFYSVSPTPIYKKSLKNHIFPEMFCQGVMKVTLIPSHTRCDNHNLLEQFPIRDPSWNRMEHDSVTVLLSLYLCDCKFLQSVVHNFLLSSGNIVCLLSLLDQILQTADLSSSA